MFSARITTQRVCVNLVLAQRHCIAVSPRQGPVCSIQCLPRSQLHVARWKSGSSFPYLEQCAALDCLDDVAARKRIASSGDLISICQAAQESVANKTRTHSLGFALRSCAKLFSDENAVTSLIVSVLDRVADLPPNTWLDSGNQNELRWILYWASQCRSTTVRFENVILQHLNVQSTNKHVDVARCVYSLRNLNTASEKLAVTLMQRFLQLPVPTGVHRSTGTYQALLLNVILYCALSGVDCSVLTTKADMTRIISRCEPTQVQLALRLTPLQATDRQRRRIDALCSPIFARKTPKRADAHALMAHLLGDRHVLPATQVAGVNVHAVAVFDADLRPMPAGQVPGGVLADAGVAMGAARRHGLHVVAAIGYGERWFLRHPGDAFTGALHVHALSTVGCYTLPVRLEPEGEKPQTQFRVVTEMMYNFPGHIHPFAGYVAPCVAAGALAELGGP